MDVLVMQVVFDVDVDVDAGVSVGCLVFGIDNTIQHSTAHHTTPHHSQDSTHVILHERIDQIP